MLSVTVVDLVAMKGSNTLILAWLITVYQFALDTWIPFTISFFRTRKSWKFVHLRDVDSILFTILRIRNDKFP